MTATTDSLLGRSYVMEKRKLTFWTSVHACSLSSLTLPAELATRERHAKVVKTRFSTKY